METQKTEEIIRELLLKSRWNRNSDYALYADYISCLRPDIKPTNYYSVMAKHKEYQLQSFKTIERIRRKIQMQAKETNDERFMSDTMISKYRKELEGEYHKEFKRK